MLTHCTYYNKRALFINGKHQYDIEGHLAWMPQAPDNTHNGGRQAGRSYHSHHMAAVETQSFSAPLRTLNRAFVDRQLKSLQSKFIFLALP